MSRGLPTRRLAELVGAALDRRAALLADPQTNVGRLFDGRGDGLEGLVVERLGDVLIAQLHAGRLAVEEESARAACALLAERLGSRAVYRKVFPADRSVKSHELDALHRDSQPWIGSPVEAEFAVREAGLSYLVRPYDGYTTGLFLDHRRQRAWVREQASGLRILNTFAFTCAFTVTAMAGGATSSANVDLSKSYLEWGKRNLSANGTGWADRHRFYCSDVLEFYVRAGRQGHEYDLILLDPPTFSRRKRSRKTFEVQRDLPELVAGSLTLLANGGQVLLSVNHRGTSAQRLREAVEAAAESNGRRVEWAPGRWLPADFRDKQAAATVVVCRVE